MHGHSQLPLHTYPPTQSFHMMTSPAGTTSASPVLLLVLVVAALAVGARATPITITNRCFFTVWPAVAPALGGIELRPGANWTVDAPKITGATTIWGRTGCSFDKAGRGHCRTGDCGGGLWCGGDPAAPVAKAEVSVFQSSYYYGITTLKGFNLPLDFACSSGDALRCREAGCHVAYPYEKYYQHTCSASGSRLQLVFCP